LLFCIFGAKVRISEQNAKGKLVFLFFFERKIATPHSLPSGKRTFFVYEKSTNKKQNDQIFLDI
jgi:hypothetical protein